MRISAARRRQYLWDARLDLPLLLTRMANLDVNDWLDEKKRQAKKRRAKRK